MSMKRCWAAPEAGRGRCGTGTKDSGREGVSSGGDHSAGFRRGIVLPARVDGRVVSRCSTWDVVATDSSTVDDIVAISERQAVSGS